MTIVFDILHLAVAAVLAIIGVEYEREQDCPPVRFEPAAHVETVDSAKAGSETAELVYASDCESDGRTVRFPAL